MSVTLREKKSADKKTITYYLDIYDNGKRRCEFLKHIKVLAHPKSPIDKQAKKENRAKAELIHLKRSQELLATDYNIVTDIGRKTEVLAWMDAFEKKYDKADKRVITGVLNRFKTFLGDRKLSNITFGRINETVIADFQDALRKTCKGEGSASYFSRFKKMMKRAYRERLMEHNPAGDVPTVKGKAKRKMTLTLDELKILTDTPTEAIQVKNAFLFSCQTGLRWVDVKNLMWQNIDGDIMTVTQSKTGNNVVTRLNKRALSLIGQRGKPRQTVFELGSANGCNKSVKAWVLRAGITKKITWHCARHTFGTLLVFYGTDIISAANLLGHSGLKIMPTYVKAADELKQTATAKLDY